MADKDSKEKEALRRCISVLGKSKSNSKDVLAAVNEASVLVKQREKVGLDLLPTLGTALATHLRVSSEDERLHPLYSHAPRTHIVLHSLAPEPSPF